MLHQKRHNKRVLPLKIFFFLVNLKRTYNVCYLQTIYKVQPSRFNPCCCGECGWHQSYFIKSSHFFHWTYPTASLESASTMHAIRQKFLYTVNFPSLSIVLNSPDDSFFL